MTGDDETMTYVTRYRASAEEIATPALDRAILGAATRHATRRRVMRRAGGAGVLALTALSVAAVWHVHRATLPAPVVTNYGRIEGSTRAYLLQAGASEFSGPGSHEGMP